MFKNNEVICFLGDSLTASGFFVAECYQHIRKTRDVKCYNCGIAGGKAAYASEYLYSYCLSRNPDTVVIMFGMNDIGFGYYSKDYTNIDREKKKREAIEKHKECYEKVVRDCLNFGSSVIICTPLPYDEFDKDKTGENLYCQAALDECAEFVSSLARKYSLPLADIRSLMLPIIKAHPELMTQDRMHPTALGYHAMTQMFLKEIGEIEEADFSAPFRFEEWNHERYSVERRLKLIEFIDYVALYEKARDNKWNTTEKKLEARKIYDSEENKAAFLPMCCKYYIEHANERNTIFNELIRLTICKK